MSRSYKKSPVSSDHTTPETCWAKRQAAKAVRRYAGCMNNGKWYRKVYCSWNISDYKFYQTRKQAIREWEKNERYQSKFSLVEIIYDWEKFYRRK
ncbi:hypothetical protein [Paenibacillus sp. FSL H8-0537]|uniref:hypothetical protein n=1 Tax=Paenibacillus sp. FSL H8-0537 TaxID=2921399 RepID=UPI0031017947